MEFSGDYHMHTLYSDGRAGVQEMVSAADRRGLREVGLADHGPRNIGTGVRNEEVFLQIKKELRSLEESYPSLRLLAGAEANIICPDGRLDLSEMIIKDLDFLVVGLHPYVLPRGVDGWKWVLGNHVFPRSGLLGSRVKNQNTKALMEAVYRYDVRLVSHPGLKMEIEIPEVARACQARGTAWEINTGHKFPNYSQILEAKRWGVDFIVNSDAHYPESVGNLEYGAWVLEKAGVDVGRVRNAVH